MLPQTLSTLALLTTLPFALGHGHQVPLSDPDADWATRHMAGIPFSYSIQSPLDL